LPALASLACPHAKAGQRPRVKTVAASAIELKARSIRNGGVRGAISWPPDFIKPPDSLMPATRRLPASRLLAGRVVQVHDDLPDLLFGLSVLPRRNYCVTRRVFPGESWPHVRVSSYEVRLLMLC